MAEDWTTMAPKPGDLATDKKWHVFVSYRSSHRAWVLALYDILNGLGYRVFVDQYVLVAGSGLATSLGDALNSSQSAILVWSTDYRDSEWCTDEYNVLESKAKKKDGFRFGIAGIEDSKPDGLAEGKLWVDFSDQPEGPSGTSMLRLLYGLRGEPLPESAVKMAEAVDEQMRDGLNSVKSYRSNGNPAGLIDLAKTENMAWSSSPMLLCAAADALIALKRVPDALEVLHRAENSFPKALRPKQLRGLALARDGKIEEAQFVMGKLYADGQIGPETLGIYARTWFDRYKGEGKRVHLLKSRDLYLQAFNAFPTDFYTGINAATKSLLAGEKDKATELAERVLAGTGEEPDPTNYWKTATIAEAQLLLGRFDGAAKTYEAAVVSAPDETGSHESTCSQAALVLDELGATDEQKALVLRVFPVHQANADAD